MAELVKLFVRTYVYWVGLIFGLAITPGSLLFTAGVAPASMPLLLAPVAGLVLLIIDSPVSWNRPLWRSLLIRVLGAGCATIALGAFDAVSSTDYGSRHWGETFLSLGLGWLVFTVVAGYVLKTHPTSFNKNFGWRRDGFRTFVVWIGIWLGIFYIPATGLAAAGTLLMVIPLYGTFLTGLVLLVVDPPRRWPQPGAAALWIRLLASGAAALLLAAESTLYRDPSTHEVFVGDWQENLIFCLGAWGLYVAVAGVTYLMCDPSHEPYDNLSK